MGVEDVVRRIEAEAEEEQKAIIDEAMARSVGIKEEELSRIENELKEIRRSFEREKASLVNVYLSEGRRKARQAVLAAKENVIWEAVSGIRKRFSDLDGSELEALLRKFSERSRKGLGPGISIYAVRRKDSEMLEKCGAEVAGIIEGDDPLPDGISRLRSRSLMGGFIAISKDGRRALDMTFGGTLERDKERVRSKISEILFRE
ncbi:MAG: V-type ATP synthase subunit E [Candidatus Thermoplasmatota archaeon]|nr:V-type ATP synthase subunit E [Candidatus Thermoplasmatota archaeon]